MKNYQTKIWRNAKLYAASLITLGAASFSTQVAADFAANTEIINTVYIQWDDALSNTLTDNISTTVTVDLVSVAPTVAINTQTPSPTDENTAASVSFDVTNNSNGPDTISIGGGVVGDTNMDTGGFTGDSYSPVSGFSLGATTVLIATAATNTTVTVPYDGTNDNVANGIQNGTRIIDSNGAEYLVDTVVETPLTQTAVITLDAAGPNSGQFTGINAIGTVIGEIVTVTRNFTTGDAAAGDGSQDIGSTSFTASGGGSNSADPTAFTVTDGTVTLVVTKYSRNTDLPVVAGTGSQPVGGTVWTEFYTADILGAPGDTIEYLIELENTTTLDADFVVVADPIPLYSSYVDGSVNIDANCDGDLGDAEDVTAVGVDANDDDGSEAEFDSVNQSICIYPGDDGVGNMGNNSAAGETCDETGPTYNGTGGTIAGGNTVCVMFSVTIQN